MRYEEFYCIEALPINAYVDNNTRNLAETEITAVCENLGNTQIFCEHVVSCAQKGNQPAMPLVQAHLYGTAYVTC